MPTSLSVPSMQSVASLLSLLSREDAERVLARLPHGEADTLRSCDLQSNETLGRLDLARRFLRDYAHARSAKRTIRMDAAEPSPPPFHFLGTLLPSQIARLLEDELPEAAAAVLRSLPAPRIADVLALMDADRQVAVVSHLATGEPIQRDVLQDIADSLAAKIRR